MSKIEWTDVTWNPVTGCDKVSQGCKICYAEKMHKRLMHIAPHKYTKNFLGNIEIHLDELKKPFTWTKPKKIFVNSMSDLFHEDVPFDFIAKVFAVIAMCPHHTFQILTKRPLRARDFFIEYAFDEREANLLWAKYGNGGKRGYIVENDARLKNVWIGTSVEDQKTVEERVFLLAQIPAVGVRFLSCEPLLGKIEFEKYYCGGRWHNGLENINWIIAGGESGHNARPMHPDWVRSIQRQCNAAGVPFFFKQWGEWIDNQNFPREHISLKRLEQHVFGNGYFSTEVWKLGKSKTGNFLDGKQHLEFPLIK